MYIRPGRKGFVDDPGTTRHWKETPIFTRIFLSTIVFVTNLYTDRNDPLAWNSNIRRYNVKILLLDVTIDL